MSYLQNGTKSKQRGVITIPGGSGVTATATLSPAVDPAKSTLSLLGYGKPAGSSATYQDIPSYVVLTNGTTVTAKCISALNGAVEVSWELEEKYR